MLSNVRSGFLSLHDNMQKARFREGVACIAVCILSMQVISRLWYSWNWLVEKLRIQRLWWRAYVLVMYCHIDSYIHWFNIRRPNLCG
jgi:hypothetical protein